MGEPPTRMKFMRVTSGFLDVFAGKREAVCASSDKGARLETSLETLSAAGIACPNPQTVCANSAVAVPKGVVLVLLVVNLCKANSQGELAPEPMIYLAPESAAFTRATVSCTLGADICIVRWMRPRTRCSSSPHRRGYSVPWGCPNECLQPLRASTG